MRTYDPGLYTLSWGEIIFSGFMSGSMIKVARAADAFKSEAGAQGELVRVRSRRRDGMVTAILQKTSPINDLLSAAALLDETALPGVVSLGVKPMIMKDLGGTTVVNSPFTWARKIPDLDVKDSLPGCEWIFDCDQLTYFLGGVVI